MPLFHKEPNLCASIFNEELHATIGNHRVIRLFKHFTATGRLWHGGLGGASPTICSKFYVRDGLHFNMTGSKLLGALMSQVIFKDKETRPSHNVPMCEKPEASIRSSTSALIQEPAYVPRPHIVFSDTSPPPPSTDLHQYPPLPGSERVGLAEHAVLTGYSDAASKVPLISQENKKRTSCNRKCKFLVLTYFTIFLNARLVIPEFCSQSFL